MAEKRTHVPLEQRRRELTETAVRVMARDGAWALTTRAVAKEAGVPHGTVHYAFSSKNELLREVMRLDISHLNDLAATQREREISSAQDVRHAVAEVFTAYADSVMADPDTETAYFELSLMAARDPELRALSGQSQGEYRAVVAQLLEDMAARTGLAWDADVALVAEQALSGLFGAAVGWLEHRDDALFRALLDDAAEVLARRLG
ncbi:TetR family transcriptional regulator [Micrococcus yunnanensis]|uniref:TetR/AcrR family transcriptional regulator n=1 Tax=Micrococcus yunnanensis TaxID=566027 RepID=UPI00107172B0|nr:TetR family transcriptional regulator [Micrococcus yunnanensis]MBF0744545.1 TetR family transcriptional regulator [Micrococcus yunnanensis]TFU55483.1 TetR family transcriptional regulator [Micrococcus yunnanensis]